MLDKRCHYKIRELSKFYLFIKHKKIYYAYFPQQKITRSTGMTDVHKAYIEAWNILDGLDKNDRTVYKPYDNPKRQRDPKKGSFLHRPKPTFDTICIDNKIFRCL